MQTFRDFNDRANLFRSARQCGCFGAELSLRSGPELPRSLPLDFFATTVLEAGAYLYDGQNRGAICRLSLFVEIRISANFRQDRITRLSRSVT